MGGCQPLRRTDSVTVKQVGRALEVICWQEGYSGNAENGRGVSPGEKKADYSCCYEQKVCYQQLR